MLKMLKGAVAIAIIAAVSSDPVGAADYNECTIMNDWVTIEGPVQYYHSGTIDAGSEIETITLSEWHLIGHAEGHDVLSIYTHVAWGHDEDESCDAGSGY